MNGKRSSKRRSKLMAASAIALTLTISGGLLSGNSVFAATSGSSATNHTQASKMSKHAIHRGGLPFLKGYEDKLAAYLQLDVASLKEKMRTETLADIAAEQGISRDDLKAQIVSWMKEAQAARGDSSSVSTDTTSTNRETPDFASLVDKLLDAKGGDFLKGGRGGHGKGNDLSKDKLASLLGITADELDQARQSGETLAQAAADHGISRDALKEKLVAWIEQNKPAPASNAQGADSKASSTRPAFDPSAWADKLLDSTVGSFGGGGKMRVGLGANQDAIASALGMTTDELRTALKSGKTIADAAKQQGINVQTVIDALTAAMQKNLSEELNAGKITQEQYDNAAEKLSARAEAIVNEQGRGGRGSFGKRINPNSAQEDTTAENSTADDGSAE